MLADTSTPVTIDTGQSALTAHGKMANAVASRSALI
jgi:hypothetical protein